MPCPARGTVRSRRASPRFVRIGDAELASDSAALEGMPQCHPRVSPLRAPLEERTKPQRDVHRPFGYGVPDERLVRGCLARGRQLRLRRLALAKLAAALGLGVHLGAEEEREVAQPKPGEHHDDG